MVAFSESRARKKRRAVYGFEVREVLTKIWRLFDCPCGQRLRAILDVELERLCRIGAIDISGPLRRKLERISAATMDRILKPVKEGWRYERRSSNGCSRNLLYKRIPLRLTDWDLSEVGWVEMDLVAYCGASVAG